jgi:hypothetical protein
VLVVGNVSLTASVVVLSAALVLGGVVTFASAVAAVVVAGVATGCAGTSVRVVVTSWFVDARIGGARASGCPIVSGTGRGAVSGEAVTVRRGRATGGTRRP